MVYIASESLNGRIDDTNIAIADPNRTGWLFTRVCAYLSMHSLIVIKMTKVLISLFSYYSSYRHICLQLIGPSPDLAVAIADNTSSTHSKTKTKTNSSISNCEEETSLSVALPIAFPTWLL